MWLWKCQLQDSSALRSMCSTSPWSMGVLIHILIRRRKARRWADLLFDVRNRRSGRHVVNFRGANGAGADTSGNAELCNAFELRMWPRRAAGVIPHSCVSGQLAEDCGVAAHTTMRDCAVDGFFESLAALLSTDTAERRL